MSAVTITDVTVLNNPAPFLTPLEFEITYESVIPLPDDLEWELIYIGSAYDETYDQLLENVLVGPVHVGKYRFVSQADPPDHTKIPEEEILGVTALLLTCSYLGQEFIRIGYYINNEYDDERLREEPPPMILIGKVQRYILSDRPHVKKFPIDFHPDASGSRGQQQSPPTPSENYTRDESQPDEDSK